MMQSKKKLVITGSSGFLGYHLLQQAIHEYEVYALVNHHTPLLQNVSVHRCDLTNYVETGNLLDDIEPDIVVHAAAMPDTSVCEAQPNETYPINVEAAVNLAGICSDYAIPFVFTSTDLVFDGKRSMYTELDAVNPVNEYGRQKAIAEERISNVYPASLIARLPMMFGYPQASSRNFMQQMISKIKNGEEVHLFTDEFRSACSAVEISKGILQLMHKHTGTFHLAGPERISRYALGLRAAQLLGLPTDKIVGCRQEDVKMLMPRPKDVSLDITKAKEAGFQPIGLNNQLQYVYAD